MGNEKLPLNDVYREIADALGLEAAESIYQMFRGQQISFPQRFFHPDRVKEQIRLEYDGSNVRELAKKYDYSEKTVRRIIKEHTVSEVNENGIIGSSDQERHQ